MASSEDHLSTLSHALQSAVAHLLENEVELDGPGQIS